MAVVKCKYKFGDKLYFINDPDQNAYFLIGLIGRPSGTLYELSYLGEIIEAYDFEISDSKDPFQTLGIDKTAEDGE